MVTESSVFIVQTVESEDLLYVPEIDEACLKASRNKTNALGGLT